MTAKLAGAGAFVMALCCALLPLIGGALIATAGTVGLALGMLVLVAVVVRRRRC